MYNLRSVSAFLFIGLHSFLCPLPYWNVILFESLGKHAALFGLV